MRVLWLAREESRLRDPSHPYKGRLRHARRRQKCASVKVKLTTNEGSLAWICLAWLGATNAVIATVPVGRNPFDMAITPDGSQAYVANTGG